LASADGRASRFAAARFWNPRRDVAPPTRRSSAGGRPALLPPPRERTSRSLSRARPGPRSVVGAGQEDLEGEQAHGRTGRDIAGNGGGSLRTRQWSKALKSAVLSDLRWGSSRKRVTMSTRIPKPTRGPCGGFGRGEVLEVQQRRKARPLWRTRESPRGDGRCLGTHQSWGHCLCVARRSVPAAVDTGSLLRQRRGIDRSGDVDAFG
jgi:hypothetical protein